jgi:hypothetical protein
MPKASLRTAATTCRSNHYDKRSSRKDAPNEIVRRLHPLSRNSADLFLTFARWPEEAGMDKELDTARNAEAAKSWAETFGVLGLKPRNL